MELFSIWPLQHRVNLACKPRGFSNVCSAGNSVLTIVNPKERCERDRMIQRTLIIVSVTVLLARHLKTLQSLSLDALCLLFSNLPTIVRCLGLPVVRQDLPDSVAVGVLCRRVLPCAAGRLETVRKNHWSGLVLTKLSFHTDSMMLYKRKVTFLEPMPILGYICVYIFCSVTVQYGSTALLAFTLYPQCK